MIVNRPISGGIINLFHGNLSLFPKTNIDKLKFYQDPWGSKTSGFIPNKITLKKKKPVTKSIATGNNKD